MTKREVLIDIRNIIIAGNALAISLPKDWIKKNNVKAGQRAVIKVEIIENAKDIKIIK